MHLDRTLAGLSDDGRRVPRRQSVLSEDVARSGNLSGGEDMLAEIGRGRGRGRGRERGTDCRSANEESRPAYT